MNEHKVCVIIPIYNNVKTISKVIDQCLTHTKSIIVVDDGSDDGSTEIILSKNVFHYKLPRNQGKGEAIKRGFKIAIDQGYNHAITIDADGQHFPDDIPRFIELSSRHPDTIIIGTRSINENLSAGTKIGLFFSNLFFPVCTHQKCQDTQSGYRLYPIIELDSLKLSSRRYDFEIELLVKACWVGVEIVHLPIVAYYDDPKERISHLKVGRDGLRGTIIYTKLIIMSIFKLPAILKKQKVNNL
ncbi:MAG: hypothetical protein IEMM0008_1176 [bacterium]|nr:MAG: hypothetical protein IEMM0008_1176 [bacterium]